MLERYQKLLSDLRKKENHIDSSPEFIETLFEQLDTAKWLKFKATSESQLQHAEKAEELFQQIMKRLYVPTPQLNNV